MLRSRSVCIPPIGPRFKHLIEHYNPLDPDSCPLACLYLERQRSRYTQKSRYSRGTL